MFRQIVRAGMNLKLSSDELDSIIHLFDNNGNANGCEFILVFYRLRYEHRSKAFTERLIRQKRARESQKVQQEKMIQELEGKAHLSLVDDYTSEDLDSAMKKIIEAAVKYDRLMPGAVQLDAFDCEFMPPNVLRYSKYHLIFARLRFFCSFTATVVLSYDLISPFLHICREQLKMVFNISLTVQELSAFIRNFNKSNANGDNINCAAFLVSFFRAGFQEKSNRLHAVWKAEQRHQEAVKKKQLEDIRAQEAKNALKCDFNYTEQDKENAIRKLRTAAKLYDKTTPGAMSMKAFEVKEMAPHVFKEQLRRIFNLNVNPQEMGALMDVFDGKALLLYSLDFTVS